jgi:hypothetical protein
LSLVLPRFALAGAACTAGNFDPSALRGEAAEGDWLVYRNAKNGLSFRYPPSMRVEERDPATFHFDNPSEVIVDLRGDELNNLNIIVMRFMCGGREQTPEMAGGEGPRATRTVSQRTRMGLCLDADRRS